MWATTTFALLLLLLSLLFIQWALSRSSID
jgi:hypothetical protein